MEVYNLAVRIIDVLMKKTSKFAELTDCYFVYHLFGKQI